MITDQEFKEVNKHLCNAVGMAPEEILTLPHDEQISMFSTLKIARLCTVDLQGYETVAHKLFSRARKQINRW